MEYKASSTNIVADALSRWDTKEAVVLALSTPWFDFIDRLRQANTSGPAMVALRSEIATGQRAAPWSLVDNLVAFQECLYILPASPLLQEMIAAIHGGGHEGIQRAFHRLRRDFHSRTFAQWPRTTTEPTQPASATNPSNSTQHACSCHCLCPPRCGQTSGLTSSMR